MGKLIWTVHRQTHLHLLQLRCTKKFPATKALYITPHQHMQGDSMPVRRFNNCDIVLNREGRVVGPLQMARKDPAVKAS